MRTVSISVDTVHDAVTGSWYAVVHIGGVRLQSVPCDDEATAEQLGDEIEAALAGPTEEEDN